MRFTSIVSSLVLLIEVASGTNCTSKNIKVRKEWYVVDLQQWFRFQLLIISGEHSRSRKGLIIYTP